MKCLLKRLLLSLCFILLFSSFLLPFPAKADLHPSPLLDAALSLLEADSPFLLRYKERTGNQVEAAFELGVPYFFGGERFDLILRVRQPWQNSRYYKTHNYYVYGLDCSGYTRWVMQQAGFPEHPSISTMFTYKSRYQDHILALQDTPMEAIHLQAQPGDLYMMRKLQGYHIMLYIGSLRDYGYDEASVEQDLAPYLDYPLMAHSSENAFYYERYKGWVAEHIKMTPVTLPDGGVMVSLLGVPLETAPLRAIIPGAEAALSHYFLVDGYALTLFDESPIISSQ